MSVQRREINTITEINAKSLSSLKKLRNAAERQSSLKENLVESLEPDLALLKHRFENLNMHGDQSISA